MVDDHKNHTSTTSVLTIGERITGNLELPADQDWFRVTLLAGVTYVFELFGSDGGGGTLGVGSAEARLSLYDADGYLERSAINGGTGSDPRMSFTPTVSGFHYLGVSELYGEGTGTYTLSAVVATVADDHGNDTSTSSILPVDGQITGDIELPADQDWFRITLQSGVTYLFELRGSDGGGGTLGAGFDEAYLKLYDDAGSFIQSAINAGTGGDPLMSFTPAVPGFHYLVAAELYDAGTGTYTLSASSVPNNENHAPVGTVTISGPAVQGQALVASNTLGDADGLGTFAYQWYADNTPIPGTVGPRLTLTAAQVGKTISVSVIYLDGGGTTESVTSAPTAPVAPIGMPGRTVNGTFGNDAALIGGDDDDTIRGFSGSDTLSGYGGDDILDGGSGAQTDRDLAIYTGSIADYSLSRNGAGLSIADVKGDRDGADIAFNLERLQFADMGVNLTVQGAAASIDPATLDRICGLYLGFFARVPAADGLEHWVNQFRNGKSLDTIAGDFYGVGCSEALRSATGYWDFANDRALSDNDFVSIAYRNVLGREGLDAGIDYWAGQLTGPGAKTRGELVGTMLDAVASLADDSSWGWVARLLDDRVAMSKRVAVDWGLNYGASAAEAIAKGVEIAKAINEMPNPDPKYPDIPVKTFDFDAAITLIGVSAERIDLIG